MNLRVALALAVVMSVGPAVANAAEAGNRGSLAGGLPNSDEPAELYVWGQNVATPEAIALPEHVAQLDASNVQDFVLTTGGQVYQTRIGKAKTTRVSLPEPMITTGEARSSGMAINAHDEGWVWGEDHKDHLCTTDPSKSPVSPVHPAALTAVIATQGGDVHTMWLKSNGTVVTCGGNHAGELGVGQGVSESSKPLPVPGLEGVVEISAGEFQDLARTASGEVYAWGGNRWGQTCTGSTAKAVWTPQRVTLPAPAKQISAGGDFGDNSSSLILLQNGEVYGCGANRYGQAAPDSSEKTLISPTSTGLKLVTAVTGGETSFGITEAGELVAWGHAISGLIGNRTGEVRTPVAMLQHVKSVSATANTVEALK